MVRTCYYCGKEIERIMAKDATTAMVMHIMSRHSGSRRTMQTGGDYRPDWQSKVNILEDQVRSGLFDG